MSRVAFTFTDYQLEIIHDMCELSGQTRPAFRWYFGLARTDEIDTYDVEDWVIDFYNAYNNKFPRTY